MKISPARTAAFDILLRIETEKAFSSALLPMYEENLSPADRSLCHELTLGTLRRQFFLDSLIDTLSGGKKLDIQVRIALRLALYQIKFLDKVPAYSAINESVNLVQRAKKTSAKGFVNAVLRRASRENIELKFADEIDRISVNTSHPRWLIEKWRNHFGVETADKIAVANNEIPVTAFRIVKPGPEVDQLVERSRPSAVVDGCFLLTGIDQHVLSLVDTGSIYLQDEASQIAAASVEITEGGRFLDVCAAPGGKTGLIAGRFANNAGFLAAGDLHWQRAVHLRDNVRRQTGDPVQVLQYDAVRSLPFAEKSFDVILVDAPCSGTGTIRHNPELRYLLTPADIEKLPIKQLSILSNASKLVRSGGTVVYSTCSLEREENENVCLRFLSENQEFNSTRPKVNDRFVSPDGFARTWPHLDGMDGFFIAAFQRGQNPLRKRGD